MYFKFQIKNSRRHLKTCVRQYRVRLCHVTVRLCNDRVRPHLLVPDIVHLGLDHQGHPLGHLVVLPVPLARRPDRQILALLDRHPDHPAVLQLVLPREFQNQNLPEVVVVELFCLLSKEEHAYAKLDLHVKKKGLVASLVLNRFKPVQSQFKNNRQCLQVVVEEWIS